MEWYGHSDEKSHKSCLFSIRVLHLEPHLHMQVLATRCLVNCCVVNGTNKILFPWSILSTGESGVTVQQFYEQKVIHELNSPEEVELEAAFLGKSKESLDRIELSLSLDSAVPLFGPFLRYCTCSSEQVPPPSRDAFAILMASQKQLSMPGLPQSVTVRTRKDKLYNDFIGFLKEENVTFPANSVNSCGKNFTKVMVDCLWYVDGHHETLRKQSCPIPQLFQQFVGYNIPEVSKHRKRQVSNMSSTVLSTLASSLYQNLQGSFWSHVSFHTIGYSSRHDCLPKVWLDMLTTFHLKTR